MLDKNKLVNKSSDKKASYFTDLKWIKKHYGEKTSLICKELFSQILEVPGCLPSILKSHFAYNTRLGYDVEHMEKKTEFKNFIFSFFERDVAFAKTSKTAKELLDEAGYVLFPECKTNAEMMEFEHYYARGEELCSFWKKRVDDCRVWFAVKKNVDQILRKNFTNPQRQDEYGTSVISIQFTRDAYQTLSIKNRYNHTVVNPDNTFDSNLDNIIPGLTEAFARDYGVRDSMKYQGSLSMDNYVMCQNKYFRYTNKLNNVFFCPNNTIIDNNNIVKLPESQLLIDYFIFDIQNKTVSLYFPEAKDAFVDSVKNIKDMLIESDSITLSFYDKQDIVIKISRDREIVSISDPNLKNCGNNYMLISRKVKNIDLPNLESCGTNFLYSTYHLESYNIPNLKWVQKGFLMLSDNDELTQNSTNSSN